MFKDVLPIIQKLIDNKNLSTSESEKAFRVLEEKDMESYFFFTFLTALHTKGETSAELLGLCKANAYFVPSFDIGINPDEIIDLSGTGGDKIKTPNVSTAASFILASAGVKVAKQAFFAVTGKLGSADLMQAFGVDPMAISNEGPEKLKNIIEQTGILVYHANSMADLKKRKGFFNWVNKRQEINLNINTAYHLAANAYSPIPMRRRIYGVYAERYLEPLAELFQKLGYNKGLIVYGMDGLDEFSNVGNTKVLEFTKNTTKEYVISPNSMGINLAKPDEISIEKRDMGIYDFLKVIYGIERGAKRDLILINAGAALYIMEKVANIKDGIKFAASLIDEKKVSVKFENFINYVGDINKLSEYKANLTF